MKLQRTRGFSLIEMAVAMAVIGILMAAVMPNISDWLNNAKVRTAAETLQAGLQTARNDAVKSNRTVTLWLVSLDDNKVMDNSCKLSATSGSWVASINSPEGKCATAPNKSVDPMIVATRPIGDGADGIVVSAKTLDKSQTANSVSFNGFGQVTGANGIGIVDLSTATSTRNLRIVISTGGSTFVCDPAVTDNKDPRFCPA